MKARSWLKTSWSETEWEEGTTPWERGAGIIPTARSPCHPTNHNNILCYLSSETLEGLGLARQLSTCWTSSSVFVKGTRHCGTGALVLCGGEVWRCQFYTYGETLEKERWHKVIQWNDFRAGNKTWQPWPVSYETLECIGCMRVARGGEWWLQNSLHKPRCHLQARLS